MRQACRAITVIMLVVLLFAIGSCYLYKKKAPRVSREEQRALADAVMMLGFAEEEQIRGMVAQVSSADLAKDPKAWEGKWLLLTSEVEWVQDRDGKNIAASTMVAEGTNVFWLKGPAALKVMGEEQPDLSPGDSCTAYGRVVAANAAAMGLDSTGQQALAAMDGGNVAVVPLFIAKWVE